jgi:predicted membrane-bound spermidine synthase
MFDWIVPGLLLITGTTGLVYEVAAGRLLSLHLGSAGSSQAMTLAVFLGGMALGAALADRWLWRWPLLRRAPLLSYAALEALIGLWALALPALTAFGFAQLESSVQRLAASGPTSPALGNAAKLALAAALVLPLSTAMGATLPALARAVQSRHPHRGVALVSRYYILNAAGAALGAALAGFVLLERLGLQRPLQLGGALNLAVALVVAGYSLANIQKNHEPLGGSPQIASPDGPVPAALLAAAFATGAVALTAEVLWTRIIGLLLGSSVYAFAFMLVVVIAGISAGSAIMAAAIARRGSAAMLLSGSQVLAAFSGVVLIVRLERLPVELAQLRLALPPRAELYSLWLAQAFAWVGLHFLPVAMALGAAFPALLATAQERGAPTDRATARLLAANTLGNLLGALGCGFGLMPWIGLENSLLTASGLSLLVALLVLPRPWSAGALALPGAALLAAGLMLLAAPPSGFPLIAGMFRLRDKTPDRVPRWLAEQRKQSQLLLRRDGKDATVAVHRSADGTVSLRTNGKADGSSGVDVVTQILSGLLGPLHRPHGQRAFVVGLGTGQTAAALAANPRWQVQVVELSPAVVEAAPLFAEVNNRVWQQPNVHIAVADAREALRHLPDASLDVVASEPSNPWLAGVADLFARESFARIRSKLKPGGVLIQWLQSYETSDSVVRRVICTLYQAFGYVAVYRLTSGDLALVASDQPLRVDLDAAAAALQDPSTQAYLRQLNRPALPADLPQILAAQLCGAERVAELCHGFSAPLREMQPELEYLAPRDFFAGSSALRTVQWLDQRSAATPDGLMSGDLQRWLAAHPLESPARRAMFRHLAAVNHPLDTGLAASLVPLAELPEALRRDLGDFVPLDSVAVSRRAAQCAILRRRASWLTQRPYTLFGPAVADPQLFAWAQLCVNPLAPPVFSP